MNTPTLLIGLGGIGSKTVNNIYSRLSEEDKELVEIHAIDTDVNDLTSMPYLYDEKKYTQISDKKTVGQYLHWLKDSNQQTSVTSWFPKNIPESTTMTDGAGQMRPVSRLAYHSTISREGGFQRLQDQCRNLFRVGESREQTSARIFIICSIAGGTGAGSFLQTARYLREMFAENYGRENIKIRGAFLSPMVANRFHSNEKERKRMNANGYACLKELNAMFSAVDTVNIELEYRQSQGLGVDGRLDLTIPNDPPIFDFCLVLDDKNKNNECLLSFDAYMNQFTELLYTQIFSPISRYNMSQEDNKASTIIGDNASGRFFGAAVSRLVYPHERLKSYIADKATLLSYSEDWLYLDEQYQEYLTEHKYSETINNPQSLGEYFCEKLKTDAVSETPTRFLRQCWRSLNILDEFDRPKEEKVYSFVSAIDQNIAKAIEQCSAVDKAIKEFAVPIDLPKFEDEGIENTIADMETVLDKLHKTIDENVLTVVQEVVDQLMYKPARNSEQIHPDSLLAHLQNQGEALHPVACRHFLYRLSMVIRQKLEKDISIGSQLGLTAGIDSKFSGGKGVEELLSITKRAIDRYEDIYDDPDTDIVETAEDRVKGLVGKSKLLRWITGSKIKEFAEEYVDKSNKQFQTLRKWFSLSVKERVYRQILSATNALSQEWEECFKALEQQIQKLKKATQAERLIHDRHNDSVTTYVLSCKLAKDQLWRDFKNHFNLDIVETDYKEILTHVYQDTLVSVKANKLGKPIKLVNNQEKALRIINITREKSLAAIEASGILQLNVVEALEKEAELLDKQLTTHIGNSIGALGDKAKPFISTAIDDSEDNTYDAWGYNPEVHESLGTQYENLFQGATCVNSEGYSRFELVRYRAIYGLKAEDIRFFSDGKRANENSGQGYTDYHRYIKDIEGENAGNVTPHLDKRWHLNAYLPDFNSSKRVLDQIMKERAFFYGLVFSKFQVIENDGDYFWLFNGPGYVADLKVQGRKVNGEPYFLWAALDSNPSVVSDCDSSTQKMLAIESARCQSLEETDFYNKLKKFEGLKGIDKHKHVGNIVDLILAVTQLPAGRQESPMLEEKLVDRLLEELFQFNLDFLNCRNIYDISVNAKKSLQDFTERLFSSSKSFATLDENSSLKVKLNAIKENRLSQLWTPNGESD